MFDTHLVDIILKNIFVAKCHIFTKFCDKGLFALLDRFFMGASYLFSALANKVLMLYCL